MKRTISDSENEHSEISEYNIMDLKHMKLTDDSDMNLNLSENNTKNISVNLSSDNKISDKCLCNVNSKNDSDSVGSVDLNSAIALINR